MLPDHILDLGAKQAVSSREKVLGVLLDLPIQQILINAEDQILFAVMYRIRIQLDHSLCI